MSVYLGYHMRIWPVGVGMCSKCHRRWGRMVRGASWTGVNVDARACPRCRLADGVNEWGEPVYVIPYFEGFREWWRWCFTRRTTGRFGYEVWVHIRDSRWFERRWGSPDEGKFKPARWIRCADSLGEARGCTRYRSHHLFDCRCSDGVFRPEWETIARHPVNRFIHWLGRPKRSDPDQGRYL